VIPAGSSCHLYSPSDWAYHAKVRLRINLNGEVTAVQISGATSLHQLQNKYNCQVVGVDRDAKAIGVARNEAFKNVPDADFYVEDVLNTNLFETYPDNYFSHCFCISHLVHLQIGKKKDDLIASLKRISRNVVVYERVATKDDIATKKNRSFQDYEKEYNFHLLRHLTKQAAKKEKRIGVFYWTTEDPINAKLAD
jgi:hypothetical protein